MRKRISFWSYANTSLEMDVPDEIVAQGDEAIAAYMQEGGGFPTICAQCSGWGREENLEIGDQWEPVRSEDGAIEVDDA